TGERRPELRFGDAWDFDTLRVSNLYVMRLSSGARSQLSTKGAREAIWSRDGRELFYRNGNLMLSVEVPTTRAFMPWKARVLFEGKYFVSGGPGVVSYDVAPDGRLLMLKPLEDTATHFRIIQGLEHLTHEPGK